ncbi:MAG: hypothetical protein WBM76_00920 [Woeseiaceae bacterium]|jgi:hypothetical protein
MMAGISWRLFGWQRAAGTLLQAASGDDEQNRMLAGMSLVKGGRRSFDLIENQLAAGRASAQLVQLLPDIDAVRAREVLQKVLQGEPGEIAETAKHCIDLLDRIDRLDKAGP